MSDYEGNLPWLYAGRTLRSFSTAFLTVVFPLYLADRGASATTVGLVLTLGSVISAAMMAAVGVLGDRIGRRPMLIGLGLAGAVGALALAGIGNLAVVVLASGLGGIGRGGGAGSGGAWGPFFPAEQPLLAGSVSAEHRTRAFARLGFAGVIAASAGSLVAIVPSAMHGSHFSMVDAYRVIFLVGAVVSVGVAAVSWPLREPRRRQRATVVSPMPARAGGAVPPDTTAGRPDGLSVPSEPASNLSTRQLVGRLGFTNAVNGLGFGFLGPLLTYWFHVRYGVGSAELGVLYATVNLASALPYLGAARLTRRFGSVHTVVVTRAFSVVVLALMAVVPTFLVASILLALRTGLNSLGIPARQSYTMGVAEERRRGTVAALGSLPSMVTSSISPVVGGALMGAFLDTPIVGATLFMGVNTVAYYLAFRNTRPPEERTAPGPPAGEEQAAPDVTGGAPRASPGAAPG